VALWVVQGDQTRRIGTFLTSYLVAFAAYLAALRAARGLSARGLRLALLAALAWRVALALTTPLLSDDVYRSVWEGRIQRHGGNPYAWSDRPEVEKWAPLRDEAWRRVNHKDYTAIYPPVWQMAARGVSALYDSATSFKLFAVLCEVLALGALARVLQRQGAPGERLLVLAWSPLALVEIAGGGHSEALGILTLALALQALLAGRSLPAALAAAVGALVKILPGLVALAWLPRFRPRDLPAAAFAGLAGIAGSHTGGVRLALGLLLIVALALAWRRVAVVPAAFGVVAAWLLLTPNVLPWYGLWLLPLLVLRDEPAALVFTGTIALAYLVYPPWLEGARWQVGWGVRALEYGPPLALLAWTHLRPAGARP
jgi:hypothetical protein